MRILRCNKALLLMAIIFWGNLLSAMGNVVQLNGTDSYITIADPADEEFDFNYNNKTKSMAITIWIKTIATSGTIYTRMTSSDLGFNAKLNPDGTVLGRYSGQYGKVNITTTTAINDGEWHHYAFVLTGQNVYAFVDGIQEDTVNNIDFDDGYNITENLYIGADSDGSDLLAAEIADFRIYMDSDETNVINSTIPISSIMLDSAGIFSPSHTIMQLRLNFSGNAGNVSESAVPNATVTGTVAYDSSFTYPLVRKTLIFRYALNEVTNSKTVADSSGNNHNSPTLPASVVLDEQSAEITTLGDNINTPDLGVTTNTVTYAGWIKPKVGAIIPQWSGLIMCRSGAATGLMVRDNGATTAKLSAHWNDSWWPETDVVVTKGQWNFVVMAVSATETTFYAATASSVDLANQKYHRLNVAAPVGIMNIGMDNAPERTFLGNMMGIRIWNETLDIVTIEALFDAEKDAALTTSIGMIISQNGTKLTWSVENEVEVKQYRVVDAITGEIFEIIVAVNGSYTATVPKGIAVKLVVIYNSGVSQTYSCRL